MSSSWWEGDTTKVDIMKKRFARPEIPDTKKVLKFALNAESAKLKFTYVTVIAKARPQ